MSQKDYIKGGNRLINPPTSSVGTSLRRVLSILMHRPTSPILAPAPPYSPFCYLPNGSYIGPNVLSVYNNKHTKGYRKAASQLIWLSPNPEILAVPTILTYS